MQQNVAVQHPDPRVVGEELDVRGVVWGKQYGVEVDGAALGWVAIDVEQAGKRSPTSTPTPAQPVLDATGTVLTDQLPALGGETLTGRF